MTECEHNDYEMIGNFPGNMEIEGESMMNRIKCLDCGLIGKEFYEFTVREWDNT